MFEKLEEDYLNIEVEEKGEINKIAPIGEELTAPQFEDLIYEENVKEILRLIIQKARKENINLLLFGQEGTGKSSTGRMLSVETGRPFIYLNGNMRSEKVINILSNLKPNCLVLIDEIHSWNTKTSEIIYPAIQDGELAVDGKIVPLDCMFVATTTEPQALSKPLRNRFQEIELSELDKDLLMELLEKKGCNKQVSEYLLNFSTNIRILNNLLNMMQLYGDYSLKTLEKVFRLKKINLYSGLSDLQEKYLEIVKKHKKVGVRIISLFLRKSEDYIKYEIEPDLIKKGYIAITSRGREINPEFQDFGYEELKKIDKNKTFSQDERDIAIKYLNDNPEIKKKFGNRYLELVNWLSEKIAQGCMPDEIDIYSFSNDCSIEESFKNNYLEDL